jgi:hypothetical protein
LPKQLNEFCLCETGGSTRWLVFNVQRFRNDAIDDIVHSGNTIGGSGWELSGGEMVGEKLEWKMGVNGLGIGKVVWRRGEWRGESRWR